MAPSVSPKRFALLVGIDLYLNDGSRKSEKGESLSLRNLRGCVNDIKAVEEFLRNEFQLEGPSILTSSLTPLSLVPSTTPSEPPDCWPTFENIKREFNAVSEQASAGDLFFFHFSGHGAQLQPTSKSPPGRSTDASLITMDFCNGRPALRGWQLNEWLKRLNEKKIRTIIILDSCYAGGSWRTGGRFRTPEGWTNVPNILADEEAITETASKSNFRDGELEMTWSINPEGFTLMAACESHEQAVEKTVNGKSYGAFTHGFLACLRENPPSSMAVTYRNLRDQISKRLNQQTPRVYGRDRLAFFGNKELFSATLLVVRIERDTVFLPIGKVHGVQVRSEFTTYRPTSHIVFSVDRVDEFECSGLVPSVHAEILEHYGCQVVPCRWSLGDETLRVLVHHSLGSEFQQALHAALQDRIVGDIEITELDDSSGPDATVFRLAKRDDGGIDISGPPSIIGYEGPVRGVDLTGENIDQLATNSAIVLAHLTRFKQILALRGEASQRPVPFKLNLEPEGNGGSLSNDRKEFRFRNISESQLYFTVIVLGPGFHVKQLYPSQDSAVSVDQGDTVSFHFNMEIPNELKSYREHRDIIRTVVTKGRQLSWKNLELPHIWNAGQLECERRPNGSGRDANLRDDCCLWVQDKVILTLNETT